MLTREMKSNNVGGGNVARGPPWHPSMPRIMQDVTQKNDVMKEIT